MSTVGLSVVLAATLSCPARPPATVQQAEFQAQRLIRAGDQYQAHRNYSRALDSYRQALVMSRKWELKKLTRISLQDLGWLFASGPEPRRGKQRDFTGLDSAEAYIRQALGASRESGDSAGEASSLLELGALYAQARGEFSRGELLSSQALYVSRACGDRTGAARALYGRGVYRGRMNNLVGARQDFVNARESFALLNDTQALALTDRHLRVLDSLLADSSRLSTQDSAWDRTPLRSELEDFR